MSGSEAAIDSVTDRVNSISVRSETNVTTAAGNYSTNAKPP